MMATKNIEPTPASHSPQAMTASDSKELTITAQERSNETSSLSEKTKEGEKSSSPVLQLSWLDRYLAVWILGAIILGILLGNFVDGIEDALQRGKLVDVSAPIAVGLLVMMYPILCRVKFETLHHVFSDRRIWIQLAFSLVINWIFAPLLMLGLAWAFLPDEPGLRDGLILVGLARCIAMVLIWTRLAGGSTEYCAVLVALNSLLQLVLYAPLAVLFIRVIGHSTTRHQEVSYAPVATSVGLFLGIPLSAAVMTRAAVRIRWPRFYDGRLMPALAPLSLVGLVYTVAVLFAAQGRQLAHQAVSVVRVAAPLAVYFAVAFALALAAARRLRFAPDLAAAQAFTAASNNFELAIAVAAATYGPHSDQALAATVGPLVEVPVLLGLVYAFRWATRRGWWAAVDGDGDGNGKLAVDGDGSRGCCA